LGHFYSINHNQFGRVIKLTKNKTVLLLGSFDTKGEEYAYVEQLVINRGHHVLKVDIGVMGEPTNTKVDITADKVAEMVGETLDSLRSQGDRGAAMTAMAKGASKLIRSLYEDGKFDGILGMGGTGGSSVISAAMRNLPIGVPKVLVSTAASGDTRAMIGTKDITLIPSVVDVAGINRISMKIFRQAVGAICGMTEMPEEQEGETKPIIAISMFGNTTTSVNNCREQLTKLGYEVLVFHCTGTGGKTMEDLVDNGLIEAVLDMTTTEWADELCGGVFAAGPNRLDAPGRNGVPHLIVPGCIDMVNFGPVDTVPDKYKDRKVHVWNPSITLMRTTPEENAEMGRIFAEKANRALGPVAVMYPNKGVSILDSEGNDFWWPEADQAFLDNLKKHIRSEIEVEEWDANINDEVFSNGAVQKLLQMMKGRED
jgi:uncharacterized protein (UPF0261 family)